MNQRPTLLKPVGPASLADEKDFQLGEFLVRPSLREVEAGGARDNLEPRVMQVLVALARANGAVLSRDELIRQCWGGRIVGEDAINRCVSKVRQLAELGGRKAFEIDTIPRVGYRLRELKLSSAEPAVAVASLPAVAVDSVPPPAAFGSATTPRHWRTPAIAAAGLAIIVAGALYYFLRREPEWIVAESHMPFISTPLIERYPALAPDGTMIAYSAGTTKVARRIYLRLLNGGEAIQLTHDQGDATAPAWSPDSKTVAYLLSENGRPCRIMEIPVPAGQPRQIGQCRFSERSSLAFDPAGRTLFFADAVQRGGANRIFELDVNSGRVSLIGLPRKGPTSEDSPSSVSPDGSGLLYDRNVPDRNEVQTRVRSLTTGSDRVIATSQNGDSSAAWSNDGGTIFVAQSQGNENSLWAYPAEGGKPWRILAAGEYIGRLSTGPNGHLAMEMQFPGGQLVSVTPHSNLLPQPFDTSGLKTWCVDYASDGTFLATGWRVAAWGIWISGSNGSLHELLPLPGAACAIRWSPDGTRFAFVIPNGHGFDVPVMSRTGESVVRLHFDAKDSGLIEWTADGKSILTSQLESRGWRIWKTDLATPHKSVPITSVGWLDPRVHGTMLFAERAGAAGIWRIDGAPHRVTDQPTPEAVDVYTISGERLIYADFSDPRNPTFSATSINGGRKDRLASLPNGQTDFTFGVNPKSGVIVYTQITEDTDIGLLRLEKR